MTASLTPDQWRHFDSEIERNYPWNPWREPIRIHAGEVDGITCRLCIARYGFSPARDSARVYQTLGEFSRHMKETHDPQQHEN